MIGITELNGLYAAGESPVAVTERTLAAAAIAGERHNAITELNTDQAREAAAASEQRWRAGRPIGPLDGVPVSVKDSFHVTGLRRWHGSVVHDSAPPSAADGAPVRRLREAGAIVFAKTVMPDFGSLASGISSRFGVVTNPWDPALSPGGSSAGAAVLLAAGVGAAALGTDMAGSVRGPACHCGLVALKATQGTIAYDPPKLIGSAGPMARTVADTAALLEVVAGPDASDHLSLPGGFHWQRSDTDDLTGVRIGVLLTTAPGLTDVEPEVAAAVESQARVLSGLGAEVTVMADFVTRDDVETFATYSAVRALPDLLAAPEDLWPAVPAAVSSALLATRDMSAQEYLALEKQVEAIRARWAAVLGSYDFTMSPVLPVVGFPAGEIGPDPTVLPFENLMFTTPFNLTSMPAGTVPVAMSAAGLPIGVQIGGPRFADSRVLELLALLEQRRGFELPYPEIVPAAG